MGEEEGRGATARAISEEPVSILFNPSALTKKNVWEVNIVTLLDLLMGILSRSDKKDLRVAGMAALTSSLIYRLKVESIFALQRTAEPTPPKSRRDVEIRLIGMPYRHESTYSVSLDDLLGILESLISTIANPKDRPRRTLLDAAPPKFDDYFIPIEDIISKYRGLVMRKLATGRTSLFSAIVADLELVDRLRCFIALLFLARDGEADLEQEGRDIRVSLAAGAPRGGA